ncbi:CHAT domain-containing protein [Pyxidicoccus trucidator]|uniref:nSTAND1 domain-containing NTPase n=1 Tax=Pyxidicoccus trucidator TaxID=2709662 RepID=UPI0013DBA8AA|nr:CHAT domain-containing protein [Pyxidicoccus trucidator]
MGTARLELVGPRPAVEEQEALEDPSYELVLELTRAQRAEDPHAWLDLRPQEYRLRGELGAVRSASFPWSRSVVEDLAALAREVPDLVAARRLGEELRCFLDALDWGGHEETLERQVKQSRGPRLVVRSAAAELYSLPWELVTLKDSGLHLADLPGFSLRYEWPRSLSDKPAPTAAGQGRVLLAWSEAAGGVPDERHEQALRRASLDGGFDFDPRRDVLRRVSLESLERTLRAAREAGEPVAVLHLLCHGAPLEPESLNYGLAFNQPGGRDGRHVVDAGTLKAVLAPFKDTLRMVVLCACHGGDVGPMASHLGGIAQELHRAGLEMVVASRLPLTTEGSVLLAETLYEKLLVDSDSLEKALGAVRHRLRVEGKGLDWASLQLYARREGHPDLRPVVLRPYQGLLPFEPKNRRFFFGRSSLEAELLTRVREAEEGRRPRFQVVAGASGAGKSSVVMAGLIPQLPADVWDVVVVRPGALVRALPRTVGVRSDALGELRQRLHRVWDSEPLKDGAKASPQEVLAEARRLRQARLEKKLLLVVDQLEEVFTHLEAAERQSLMQVLWALAGEARLECVVVATLRVDAFERCGEVALDAATRLDAVVYAEEHRVFVAQLGPEELAEAIQKPARRVGLELEPGLMDRLCHDVGQEPGALPLLEHALDLLWQGREGHLLTHRLYDRMEGVAGALTQTAERLYEELEDGEREQARRLRAELVSLGEETTPDSRRRVWLEDIRPQESREQADFDRVLERLVNARLVIRSSDVERSGRVWLEVAHEALIRRWPRLRGWLRANRKRLLQWRELRAMAESWQAHRKDPDGGSSYLATGERLAAALRIGREHERHLTTPVKQFLKACEAHERRKMQRLSVWAFCLVAGMGCSVVLAIDASTQRDLLEDRVGEAGNLARLLYGTSQSLDALGTVEREALLRQVERLLLELGAATESDIRMKRLDHHLAGGDKATQAGDFAKAHAEYSQALQQATRLFADHPDTGRYQQAQGTLRSKLGDTALERGQFKDALEHYLAHRELLDVLLLRNPKDPLLLEEKKAVHDRLEKLTAPQRTPLETTEDLDADRLWHK